MPNSSPIGTTKGPGETPHEYTFVAADPEQRVRYGEFVYYEAGVDNEQRQILGRVSKRVPLRLYPDTFLSDPAVPPAVAPTPTRTTATALVTIRDAEPDGSTSGTSTAARSSAGPT